MTVTEKNPKALYQSFMAFTLFAILLGLRETEAYGPMFDILPVMGRTLPFFTLAVLLTLIYRANGGTLNNLGFGWPSWECSKKKAVLFIALWSIGLFIVRMLEGALLGPILDAIGPAASTLDRMAPLTGNLTLMISLLPIMWIAVVGEEVLFRGLVINYVAGKLGGNKSAWILAIIASAFLFGICHFWQGPRGMVATGLGALIMGAGYYLCGRTLWPTIISHALGNTLGFIAIYFGDLG